MKNLLLALTLSFTGTAFANDAHFASAKFEEMKAACQSPVKFHNQIAPTNIQVSCRDLVYRWVPDVQGSYSLATTRQVTASLISDKFTVTPLTVAVQAAPEVAQCGQFKQVAETVESVQAMSCADIIAYTGTATDYCTAAIDSLRLANASVVNSQDTGKTFSLCGAPASEAPAVTSITVYDEKRPYDDNIERDERHAKKHHFFDR